MNLKSNKILNILVLISLSIAGCSYRNPEFVSIDDYSVIGKRNISESINVRDFIRPADTKELIEKLQLSGKEEPEKVQILFTYVCSLRNIEEKNDFWQYPSETLQKGGGDCEDKVFLLLSALLEAGIKNTYALKGRYLGGGHFWVEYDGMVLDPFGKKSREIQKNKAIGYSSFFKFDNKEIYINKDI